MHTEWQANGRGNLAIRAEGFIVQSNRHALTCTIDQRGRKKNKKRGNQAKGEQIHSARHFEMMCICPAAVQKKKKKSHSVHSSSLASDDNSPPSRSFGRITRGIIENASREIHKHTEKQTNKQTAAAPLRALLWPDSCDIDGGIPFIWLLLSG